MSDGDMLVPDWKEEGVPFDDRAEPDDLGVEEDELDGQD